MTIAERVKQATKESADITTLMTNDTENSAEVMSFIKESMEAGTGLFQLYKNVPDTKDRLLALAVIQHGATAPLMAEIVFSDGSAMTDA